MAKKKAVKPPREITKRQLSRWQEQKRRQRIAFISGITIIVAVLVVLVTGWYIEQYRPLREAVLRVNGTEFSLGYYVNMLKHYGRGQTQYISYMADQVMTNIEQSELIRQGALKLGISVGDDEVDKELKSRKLGSEFRDPVRAGLLAGALQNTHFDPLVPEFAEHRQTMAMFLEDESQAAEVKARLEKGENFTDLAGQLSVEGYTKTNKGDLSWRPRGVLPTLVNSTMLEDKVFGSEVGVLSTAYDAEQNKSVGYLILKLWDREEGGSKRAHMLAILLGNKEEAQRAKARLNAGEDFAALAKELSQLGGAKDNGGDMGWITPGTWSKQVDEFIFGAETKQFAVSEPIRDETQSTKGGYWLFKVQAVENKKIEGENRDTLRAKLFNDWVKGLSEDPNNKIERLLNNAMKAWAVQKAMKS